MKKFEITKEQIILLSEQHSWSESKLKQWFPHAFKTELEVGKWYVRKQNYKCLLCYQGNERALGFGYNGSFSNNWLLSDVNIDDFKEATPKEIENALINEAKRRGYNIGVLCEFGLIKDVRNIRSNEFQYCEIDNSLYLGNDFIFYNGKWAEIIEQPKKNNHYDNSKGSIYKFCEDQKLNRYEFDLIKRIVRCRKKGQFKDDLEKTKILIDLYLVEFENNL